MQLDCIEYAAQYFSQACTEGCLLDYLAAVKKLYEDRCPSDPKVDWDTVSPSDLQNIRPDHPLVSIESLDGLHGSRP